MDLSAIRAGFATWVTSTTGLKTYWRRRPNDWQPQAWAELRISSPQMVGRDSLTYREDGDDLYPRQRGLRSFVLEVQVWSHSFADDKDSLHYTEILRDSLIRYAPTFKTFSVGFSEVRSTVTFEEEIHDRAVNMVQMDMLFYADTSAEDQAANTWIETVDMTGDLSPDGTISGEFP